MAAPGVSRWRVEARLVGLASAHGFRHGVINFQDDSFSAVVAVVLRLVLALDDGEGVHDVVHGVAWRWEAGLEPSKVLCRLFLGLAPFPAGLGRQVEMEKSSVQLATQEKTALFIPPKW